MNNLKVNQKCDATWSGKHKNTNTNCSTAKQTCINTFDPAMHLEDAQHIGRYTGNIAR